MRRIRRGGKEIRKASKVWGRMRRGSEAEDSEERDCISSSSQWTRLCSEVDSPESSCPSAFPCAGGIISYLPQRARHSTLQITFFFKLASEIIEEVYYNICLEFH